MQKKVQYIYLYFTKDDQDLLAWANMIKENNLSLSTWIQGILVAEAAKEKLNIGAVHIPPIQKPIKENSAPSLWGDDTEKKETKIIPGWHIRGENGKLIAGTVLPIKITRPLAQEALYELKKRHKKIAAYVKAVIRQTLEILQSGPDQPPNKNTVIDLFALSEDKIGKNNFNNQTRKEKKEQFRQRQENRPTRNPQLTQQNRSDQEEKINKDISPQTERTKPQPNPPPKNPLLKQID